MMSLLNLLGNLLCPQYSAIYLVRSQAMTGAERDPSGAGLFEAVVGTLVEDEIQAKEAQRRDIRTLSRSSLVNWQILGRRALQLPLLWLPTGVSVAITYGLSHFQRGSSTYGQRLATMAWLGFGSFFGVLAGEDLVRDGPRREIYLVYIFNTLILMFGSIPSVAGFIVVAQELKQYGSCSHV